MKLDFEKIYKFDKEKKNEEEMQKYTIQNFLDRFHLFKGLFLFRKDKKYMEKNEIF